jgi:acyl-homoserine-lactone acylase
VRATSGSDSDLAWRHIGIAELADEQFGDLPPAIQEMFEGFASGWNQFLDTEGVDDAWCAEWIQPIIAQDIYAVARAVSLNASSARLTGFLGTAQPPEGAGLATTSTSQALGALGDLPRVDLGSNGWAIGAERADGGPVLLGNPHFPWEGGLRFWETHLVVPGEVDVYGVQLVGLPGVGIGFNDAVAWTHTVSAGNRFTAYLLRLDPTDPTRYLKDDQPVAMRSEEVTVEVAGADPVTRTLWWSEHGPILDFPGIGWDGARTLTYRDANLDNDEFAQQYYDMNLATSLAEFQAAHERNQGVPLFNTIAVAADGTAWYADTSATPNLSEEALAAWEAAVAGDPLVGAARSQGFVLLDGSTSVNDWVEADGARDPGSSRTTACRSGRRRATCSTPTTRSGSPTWRHPSAATTPRSTAARTSPSRPAPG